MSSYFDNDNDSSVKVILLVSHICMQKMLQTLKIIGNHCIIRQLL